MSKGGPGIQISLAKLGYNTEALPLNAVIVKPDALLVGLTGNGVGLYNLIVVETLPRLI